MPFDRGYHVELLGEYQERQAAQSRLLASALIAALLILLLLQASFRSWRLAFLVFLTLPMALVGGVLAAWLTGGIISLGSLVGFFTVFGIAARNGILLINHCQHLEERGGEAFGPALVLRGARERLAPILMTSLATGLALVPLVVLGLRPGSRDRAPAGRGHPRRAVHLDAAQPVRAPVAVPAVRPGAREATYSSDLARISRRRVTLSIQPARSCRGWHPARSPRRLTTIIAAGSDRRAGGRTGSVVV